MEPTRENTSHIEIPLTFDSKRRGKPSTASKVFLGIGLTLVWGFLVFLTLAASTLGQTLLWMVVVTIAYIYVMRFLLFREHYYREKRAALEESNYMFGTNLLWSIVEVSNTFPYVVTFRNGYRGVFIALDKGVIVGKEDDYVFDHHQAIADVYKELAKAEIEFTHIDYMDSIGKDSRLNNLFSAAASIDGKNLRYLITMKYDYLEKAMQRAFSTYDVYCLYWRKDDYDALLDIREAVSGFKRANFARIRYLNKYMIGQLVQTVFNLESFSPNNAIENVLNSRELSAPLTVIWGEKDGVKTVFNLTSEEKRANMRVSAGERKLKRKRTWFKRKNEQPDEEISLD